MLPIVRSEEKFLFTPFLLQHFWMHSSRPAKLQDLALTKLIGLLSLNLGPLVKVHLQKKVQQ